MSKGIKEKSTYDGKFLAVEGLVAVVDPPRGVSFTVEGSTSVQLKAINVAEDDPFLLSLDSVTVSFDSTLKGDLNGSFAWTPHLDLTKLELSFWDHHFAW